MSSLTGFTVRFSRCRPREARSLIATQFCTRRAGREGGGRGSHCQQDEAVQQKKRCRDPDAGGGLVVVVGTAGRVTHGMCMILGSKNAGHGPHPLS